MAGAMVRFGRALTCAVVLTAASSATAAAAVLPAAGLPDGRGYELVSPPEKHGADVASDSSRTRVAADGSAVEFVSLNGFGDVHGTGQATEYLSIRSTDPMPGTNGWATHGITPPQAPLTVFDEFQALDSFWQGELSPDLSKGVFGAVSPVTDEDPNVGAALNLYRRTDLRTPGAGSYQLLTKCPACTAPFPALALLQAPRLGGASADFSHVAFQSGLPLTADAGPGVHVYEWLNGTLRLADLLPDSACGSPPCYAGSSRTGDGARFGSPHVISADGSRITFTDISTGDDENNGTLYQRIGGTQTVQINASEKTPPDSSRPAIYQTASADGTRVFFTTAEQLTSDDSNGLTDLYMWDATTPTGQHLTRLSVDGTASHTAEGVQGVLGASDDGRYVYFVARGQFIAGKPFPNLYGIYLWHDVGSPSLTYVGNLERGEDLASNIVGIGALGGGIRARVTPDGRHLAFVSHTGASLLSMYGGIDYDQTQCAGGACAEFYIYSADDNRLVCATCRPDGASATSGADTSVKNGGTAVTALHVTHPLSDDGRRFFFSTAEPIVAGDSNGKSDAYEYDAQSGTVRLISTGRDPSDAYFMDASADGSDTFFLTRQQLVGWDADGNYDMYDARVGGGFPEPPPIPSTCLGDACRGPLSGAPSTEVAGSALYKGLGDLATNVSPKPKAKPKSKAKRCRRGFVAKRVRGKLKCVRKHAAPKRKLARTHGRAR